jgi:hypothetical protein
VARRELAQEREPEQPRAEAAGGEHDEAVVADVVWEAPEPAREHVLP